jgi:hypothetical protein
MVQWVHVYTILLNGKGKEEEAGGLAVPIVVQQLIVDIL